jgi:hypothetical protein
MSLAKRSTFEDLAGKINEDQIDLAGKINEDQID